MIIDATLTEVVTSEDCSFLVEIYPADAVPEFDPADALKLYSEIANITFSGETYTRLIRSVGRIKRSIGEESNTFQVTFDNLDNEVSAFELDTTLGFEGKVLVVRLISRARVSDKDESLILFVGRCEKPKSGDRESLSVTATQVFAAIDTEIPRRKYSPDDEEGRHPSDPNFEGFRFMPQYGVTTYSERKKSGGFFGLFSGWKTVRKSLQYSSFSDLDAEKYLPFASGRVQVMGTHAAYADVGTGIRTTTPFMEGPIEALANIRTDDTRFTVHPNPTFRLGYPANQGPSPYTQVPVSVTPGVPDWPGDGYYANTVMGFLGLGGTNIDEVDEAPGIIIVTLALRQLTPNGAGVWNVTSFADDAAALTRHILTSDFYGKLDDGWIDDDSFYECWNYNKEPIFDTSYADVIFLPGATLTDEFTGGDSEKFKHLLTTGNLSPKYFEYLNDDATAEETFLRTAFVQEYETEVPIEPIEPPIDPFPGGGNGTSLSFLLRRRYTCNVVVTEQMKVVDFLTKVVFMSSRLFITQAPDGRIKLQNKKPVDWALGTAALSGTSLAVDDIREWITDYSGLLLVDPHTSESETRAVTDANYSTAQNSVVLTSSDGDLTIVGFAGCDGASTPATATITIDSLTPTNLQIELDGIEFTFTYGTADTEITVAAFLAATINAHPVTRRKFIATWVPGEDHLSIKGKFGTLVVDEALTETHTAPIADPTAAPTGAESAGGTLGAGDWFLSYSFRNARGQTLLAPYATITVTGTSKKITTGTISEPAGTTVAWYLSVAPGSYYLRYVGDNDGSAYIITDAPALTNPVHSDLNRTGTEVIRVCMSFSDREEERAYTTRANVLKATFKWILGNRTKAINVVDLAFRDATQDFRLVHLLLRDDDHIYKTKKRSKFEVNGQAIDNYNQAYRITAGLLAELRDSDFFYEWTADKESLLLEEGDVVCITDRGSGVYNFPVRIESIDISVKGGFAKCSFTARKYTTTLYDDSCAERQIPLIVEADRTEGKFLP